MQETRSWRSVLVVSRRSLLRVAIRSILAGMDLDALGEAVDKPSAALQIRIATPAVIIVDFDCPFNTAVGSYVQWIRAHEHRPRVLAICSGVDRTVLEDTAPDADLNGWLLVTTDIEAAELASGVRRLLGASLHREAFDGGRLTPRQRQILTLVANGKSNAEIGRRLVIAPGTVKRHLNDAFTALNARSRIDAVNRARSLGLM